jgi:hypothetical protein
VNLLGITLLTVFAVLILFGTRRSAIFGLLGGICYLPFNQQLFIAGFNFTCMRTLLLAGLVRVLTRREFSGWKPSVIDRAIILYLVVLTCIGTLRDGSVAQFINCVGEDYNVFLSYFVCRCLLRDYEDVIAMLLSLAYFVIPLAILMVRESVTGSDFFSLMGVRPDQDMRHGLWRAQGPFQTPILAGIFGATLIPLYFGLYYESRRWFVPMVGVSACAVITICSLSSGPFVAALVGMFCLGCWFLRDRMRGIRWLILAGFVGLAMVMKAPIWFLIARLGSIFGGSAEYRSELIDQAVKHFNQWWLLGLSDTQDWMPTHLANGNADITNQYIRDGLDGGLWGMLMYIIILTKCFSQLGKARKCQAQEGASQRGVGREKLFWCLGSAMVAHAVTQMSVEYFDQMKVAYYMLVAIIASLSSDALIEGQSAYSGENLGNENSELAFSEELTPPEMGSPQIQG